MYSATSAFAGEIAKKNIKPLREFLIGTSDYSSFVMTWPSIGKNWLELAPQSVTINLSNAAKTFNFFKSDPTKLRTSSSIKLGVQYVGSSELITIYAGTTDAIVYNNAECSLTLIDKFRRLSDRKVGDTTSATLYTSSNHLIHDMAWYACTSLGGLSAITSTSNPDIDYTSFSSWTSVFSTDNVRVRGRFTGQQPIEILKKIALLSNSAIYIESDKIKFARFNVSDPASLTLDSTTVLNASMTFDDRSVINKAWVSGDYNVTSNTFGITVSDTNSASVATYGLREEIAAETSLWFVDSNSAINLAQRITFVKKEAYGKLQIESTLFPMLHTIGDAIIYNDPLLDINDTYRIMSDTLDMDSGKKMLSIDRSQYLRAFTLDISALDSSDVLS